MNPIAGKDAGAGHSVAGFLLKLVARLRPLPPHAAREEHSDFADSWKEFEMQHQQPSRVPTLNEEAALVPHELTAALDGMRFSRATFRDLAALEQVLKGPASEPLRALPPSTLANAMRQLDQLRDQQQSSRERAHVQDLAWKLRRAIWECEARGREARAALFDLNGAAANEPVKQLDADGGQATDEVSQPRRFTSPLNPIRERFERSLRQVMSERRDEIDRLLQMASHAETTTRHKLLFWIDDQLDEFRLFVLDEAARTGARTDGAQQLRINSRLVAATEAWLDGILHHRNPRTRIAAVLFIENRANDSLAGVDIDLS